MSISVSEILVPEQDLFRLVASQAKNREIAESVQLIEAGRGFSSIELDILSKNGGSVRGLMICRDLNVSEDDLATSYTGDRITAKGFLSHSPHYHEETTLPQVYRSDPFAAMHAESSAVYWQEFGQGRNNKQANLPDNTHQLSLLLPSESGELWLGGIAFLSMEKTDDWLKKLFENQKLITQPGLFTDWKDIELAGTLFNSNILRVSRVAANMFAELSKDFNLGRSLLEGTMAYGRMVSKEPRIFTLSARDGLVPDTELYQRIPKNRHGAFKVGYVYSAGGFTLVRNGLYLLGQTRNDDYFNAEMIKLDGISTVPGLERLENRPIVVRQLLEV